LLCGAAAQLGPGLPHCYGFEITDFRHAPGKHPLNKWQAICRGHYLHNTQQTHEMDIHALSKI